MNQCPIIPGDVFQYKFNVPDQAVCYECIVAIRMWMNLHRVYLREPSGTTVTSLISIAMAYEVHLSCAILKILMQVSMMSMMVCPESGFLDSSAHLITNLDSTVITLADWCACSVS